ncbi:uncharacterized protein MELLADRAFT_114321 [Melampsora larici-populina 98AG31]|uniref:Uncharacterized protein n=1 Tax=Melampsora larici-populina (strain 98AG31 / pathotype 3-4-7) TaxID=747676 RepID=F4SD12_MELLP|nr:uncharacterized protein MELLADRAFT_114321 [Melampsora larici-populina 98AG31]EGF97465.1 hypothetical protein MELLADRAFT_114321 [Melampsora larici-populina 98AG31]
MTQTIVEYTNQFGSKICEAINTKPASFISVAFGQHDFFAERPDKLDAKTGTYHCCKLSSLTDISYLRPSTDSSLFELSRLHNSIMNSLQLNLLVVLVFVSFVEVQNLTSGKALPPDRVKEIIRSARQHMKAIVFH